MNGIMIIICFDLEAFSAYMSIYTSVSDSCLMKKYASTAPSQIQYYIYVHFIYRMGAVHYYELPSAL